MLGATLKDLRMSRNMKLKSLAAVSDIDQTLISRFEHGERLPTEEQLSLLIHALQGDAHALRVQWMAEKILKTVGYDSAAMEALSVAESRMEYLMSEKVLEKPTIPDDIEKKLTLIDELKSKWKNQQPLNVSQLKRMHEFFDTEYTYESNRIEGNTLTHQETMLVVSQGLTIGGKSLQEHLEAINHTDAIYYMRDLAQSREDISKRVILDLHRLILKGIDDSNAGKYRSVPVRISGSDVELPQPYMLEKLMEDYFRYYQLFRKRIHPVLLAADMHERLISIHPFIDGNGRTSRLVMNLILLKNGFTRVNIKGSPESRLRYFDSLAAMQKDNDPVPFYHLIADGCIESLNQHLELCG